ncbi:LacI family DNA-binding transcriptional regulator [Yinghuangia seranimata]|uniref:LacI family DNA-binding transcriptional regulator n=1 Tax=Yinghuangia seranimata TaxID=408067 RepID=UPI00248B67F8|nr:LacI family DNA-binding transcriptional regulator [Yinghuangia seranimata]MDI2129763.1 LacI family DNA-binding transcriptional regulator [Yinghuangia seranimata]
MVQVPRPGKAPTSADVARAAGVSRTTVSFVLNNVPGSGISEATREKVLAAVRKLGYSPNAGARALRAGTSNLVLYAMPRWPLGHTIHTLLERTRDALAERGLVLIVHGDRNLTGMEAARGWAELRPRAVIADSCRCTRESVAMLRQHGVHTVVLVGEEAVPYAPTVVFQQRRVGGVAAEHLVKEGHRRIAGIVPLGDLSEAGELRYAGLQDVADADPSLELTRVEMPFDHDRALAVARAWAASENRPTAVFAYNDEFAALMMRALRDVGLSVPGDVAVVGVDDTPLCELVTPRLTSVALHSTNFAEMHVKVLMEQLDRTLGDEPPVVPEHEPVLVRRDSA